MAGLLTRIAELEDLARKATPGPWHSNMGKFHARVRAENPKGNITKPVRELWTVVQSPQMTVNINNQRLEDCDFIAAANPTTILELCSALRKAVAGLEWIERVELGCGDSYREHARIFLKYL